MMRQTDTRSLHWADKTMSVLRADQLEACEKDLAGLPSHCLFESECSDLDAEKLYDISFYAEEDKKSANRTHHSVLHTVEELRSRVLHSFGPEAALLSVEEHDLLVRAMLFGGRTPLNDWNELIPARGLVRRLWCRVENIGSNAALILPSQLCATVLMLLAGDGHRDIRTIVEQVHDRIENTLYLLGAVQASGPARDMLSRLKGTSAADRPDLVNRFLLSGYDYVYNRSGSLLLIHPGLAEPERMMDISYTEMDPDSLSRASESINDLESPLYEQMLAVLQGAVRPEISPEDAVEDLIILAKQEVPWKDMLEVLSSLLICQSTPEMRSALKNLSDRVPRWLDLSTSQVQ